MSEMSNQPNRARREFWELKGLDSFGNLIFLQEVKLDTDFFNDQEYLQDSIHAAIEKSSVKIILERFSRKI